LTFNYVYNIFIVNISRSKKQIVDTKRLYNIFLNSGYWNLIDKSLKKKSKDNIAIISVSSLTW